MCVFTHTCIHMTKIPLIIQILPICRISKFKAGFNEKIHFCLLKVLLVLLTVPTQVWKVKLRLSWCLSARAHNELPSPKQSSSHPQNTNQGEVGVENVCLDVPLFFSFFLGWVFFCLFFFFLLLHLKSLFPRLRGFYLTWPVTNADHSREQFMTLVPKYLVVFVGLFNSEATGAGYESLEM